MPRSSDTLELVLHSTKNEVEILLIENPVLGKAGVRPRWEEALVGGTVRNYIPEEWQAWEDTKVCLNGQVVPRDRWSCRYVSAGDQITIGRKPTSTFAILLAAQIVIGLASSYLTKALMDEPEPPKNISPSYGSPLLKTTATADRTVPIIYGDFIAPGNIIHAFTRHSGGGNRSRRWGGGYGQFEGFLGHFRNVVVVALDEGPNDLVCGLSTESDFLYLPEGAPPNAALWTSDQLTVNGNKVVDFAGNGFVSYKPGTMFQGHVPHAVTSIREIEKDVELTVDKEFTYVTSGPSIGVRIIIFFPSAWYHVTKHGEREKQGTRIRVRWRPDGETEWSETQEIIEQIRFDDPSAWTIEKIFPELNPNTGKQGPREVPIEIGVTRLDPNKIYETLTRGTIRWLSTQEMTAGEAPTYPGTSIIALDMSVASMQGQITNLGARGRFRKVWVFDEDDPTAAPVEAWSNSPADVLIDLATSRVGLRDNMTLENVDIPNLMEWKKHCKIQIPDGAGGTIDQWQFNGAIDVERSFRDSAGLVAAAGGAKALFIGSRLKIKIEKAEDIPAQRFCLFGMGNIEEGTFKIEYPSLDDVHNVVEVEYRDRDDDFAIATQADPAEEEIGIDAPINPKRIQGIGITHRVHAKNLASLTRKLLATPSVISFGAGLDAIVCEPGDVISVMHHLPSWGGISGRLVEDAPGSLSIRLDQDVTIPDIPGAVFRILVWTTGTNADVLQLRTIVAQPGEYARGTTLTISPNWDVGDLPIKGNVYSAGVALSQDPSPNKGPFRNYRLSALTSKENFTRELRAMYYDPDNYVHPFPPPLPPPRPTVTNPWDMPPPVLQLSVTQDNKTEGGRIETPGSQGRVVLSWMDPRWLLPYKCRIYQKANTLNELTMHLVGITGELDTTFALTNLTEGWDYTVAVVPMSHDELHWRSYDAEGEARAGFRVERHGAPPPNLYDG